VYNTKSMIIHEARNSLLPGHYYYQNCMFGLYALIMVNEVIILRIKN
jgi:hypothetical protein